MFTNVHLSPCKNNSPSTVCGLSCVRRSSRVLPASENARSEEVLVAGIPRRPLASLLRVGQDVALLFQKLMRQGESPAAATHIYRRF